MTLWITFICFSTLAIVSIYCARKFKGWELFFVSLTGLWVAAALMIASGIYSQQ